MDSNAFKDSLEKLRVFCWRPRAEWTRRVPEELAVTARIPDRKPRSCDRGLRQPANNWKKIRQPTSIPLVKKITLTLTNP